MWINLETANTDVETTPILVTYMKWASLVWGSPHLIFGTLPHACCLLLP